MAFEKEMVEKGMVNTDLVSWVQRSNPAQYFILKSHLVLLTAAVISEFVPITIYKAGIDVV